MRALPDTTIKNSHLVLCQCSPFVMPGLLIFTENCPQEVVLRSSVKLPLLSTFILSGKLTFSFGRYDKYVEYSFFAKLPAGISGIIRLSG